MFQPVFMMAQSKQEHEIITKYVQELQVYITQKLGKLVKDDRQRKK